MSLIGKNPLRVASDEKGSHPLTIGSSEHLTAMFWGAHSQAGRLHSCAYTEVAVRFNHLVNDSGVR